VVSSRAARRDTGKSSEPLFATVDHNRPAADHDGDPACPSS
jgi:hypothetical protein